ncbi:hypothetical protein LWI29_004690 [Acer saccharum]|uniref:Uncharacterized protein n=1 Tax=Acer saccharum TaxID=4024 RepID=A0AA39T2F3_ACESA|nr:hypothetical protein LWI29_004690 [Acer saccharum]
MAKKSRGSFVSRLLEKGKYKWSKKITKKPLSVMIKSGSVNFEKRRADVNIGVGSSSESTSSSKVGGRKSLFLESISEKGGCSKEPVAERGEGCCSLEVSPIVSVVSDKRDRTVVGSVAAFIDRGSSDSENTKEELVWATIAAEEKGRSKGVGGGKGTEVTADSEEDLVIDTITAESKLNQPNIRQSSRIKSKGSSSHCMKTGNAKNGGAKVVSGKQVTSKDTVEVEVANVNAVRSMVGFDFSEVEEEVLDEITRTEKEDLARFEAISG